MPTFTIKRGDTSPALTATLTNESGTAVNLAASTPRFIMVDEDGNTLVDGAATITDAENGRVQYDWSPGDTDTAGWHDAEFEVTYSDNTVETFPNNGTITVRIPVDLG